MFLSKRGAGTVTLSGEVGESKEGGDRRDSQPGEDQRQQPGHDQAEADVGDQRIGAAGSGRRVRLDDVPPDRLPIALWKDPR